jgi:hypothetical protein
VARTRRAVARRVRGCLLLAVLVGLAVLRSHAGTRLDGFTVDEPWHIVAGVAAAREGNFSLNPEHPPLVKRWVGAFAPDDFRLRTQVLHNKGQERGFAARTMFSENVSDRVQAYARASMWVFSAFLLLLLGALLWRTLGLIWAAGTLGVLAIDPTVGAHLPVVMTDLPLALTLAISAVCCGLLVTDWRWSRVCWGGVAFGLTLGSKHSALAGLCGLTIMLVVAASLTPGGGSWRGIAVRIGKVAVVGVIAVLALWALYGFHFHANADGSDGFNQSFSEKMAALDSVHWRGAIGLADRWHLLPRAYLWGLADVVRVGFEGRGQDGVWLWGTFHVGGSPWYTWPTFLIIKLPIATLLLGALGAALLRFSRLTPAGRWTLCALVASGLVHMLGLMAGTATYGGVRHALPAVVAVAVLAGGAVDQSWTRRSRPLLAVVAVLFVSAVGTTIVERRLWEYHNELAGGSEGAYRLFFNESVNIGQRLPEIRSFYERVARPGNKPLYISYYDVPPEQLRATRMNIRRCVEDIYDTNVEGAYDGYFANLMWVAKAKPGKWDPAAELAGLKLIARFGNVGIWEGRLVQPKFRAVGLLNVVTDYIYDQHGTEWPLVAKRLEEILSVLPNLHVARIELGNAYLRMGDRVEALRTYRRVLSAEWPAADLVRQQVVAQIHAIEALASSSTAKPMSNPYLE